MDFDSLRKLLADEVYKKTLQAISEQASIGIEDEADSTILNIGLNNIRSSSLADADFYDHLMNQNALLTAFSVARVKAFRNAPVEQEYAEGDEPEEGEEDEVIEEGGLAVIALVGFIIDFHYLFNGDDTGLTQYLKKLKMPKAAKHKAELKEIFDSVSAG